MVNKKYHPIVKEMMDAIMTSNPTLPEEASAIICNYKLVSMISNLRIKIDYNTSMGLAPINFYGILLLDSGIGKTSSLSTLDHWYFNPIKAKLKKLFDFKKKQYISELRNSLKSNELSEEQFNDKIKELSTWTFSISSGSKEGITKLAQTLGKLGTLTASVEIDELDKYLGSEAELINTLFKAYDAGEWNPKVTAGKELQDTVYGVAPNFFGFATPDAMLLDKDVSENFRAILASGFARRTFFYYEDNDKLPYIPTSDDLFKAEEKAVELKTKSIELSEKLDLLVNREKLEKVIAFNSKAKKYLFDYRSESLERASQTNDPIMSADFRERHFKIAKLSGAYAFLDGREEVSIQDIDYAINLCEISSKSLFRIGDSKSMIERLYLRVRGEEGFVHTQDMLEFGLIGKSQTQKIKEYAEELESYADVYGDIFEVMRDTNGKISAVRITQLITTDPDSCIFSASMPKRNGEYNHDSGYKKAELEFKSISDWITQEGKVCYSATAFRNGKRSNDNAEAYSNIIIMDIDEGMKLDYAKEIFSDYYAIITTTRNHQKEKVTVGGNTKPACDRFRIVLLADKYLVTTPQKYKKLMENIQKFYNFSMDEGCFDKAHIYYSNPSEVWFGKCERKFEVAKLMPSDEDHLSKKIDRKIQSFKPDGGKALKLWFENNVSSACREGTGIINALRDAMLAINDELNDVFKTLEDAEEWIEEMADEADDSYWEKHNLENEIMNKLRIRWED